VAGGVIVDERGLLLVENRRRNGSIDWSPPGGVIDPGETPIEGLTREVEEETGVTVAGWVGPLYRVEVTAPDAGFFLAVEVHRATRFTTVRPDNDLTVDDPDGIVISAGFIDLAAVAQRLDGASPWIAEPLLSHLDDGTDDGRIFQYLVEGTSSDRRITRSQSSGPEPGG
jgi:8-oxo-dGTP diphosphatase